MEGILCMLIGAVITIFASFAVPENTKKNLS